MKKKTKKKKKEKGKSWPGPAIRNVFDCSALLCSAPLAQSAARPKTRAKKKNRGGSMMSPACIFWFGFFLVTVCAEPVHVLPIAFAKRRRGARSACWLCTAGRFEDAMQRCQ
jgi:hypothetical protein